MAFSAAAPAYAFCPSPSRLENVMDVCHVLASGWVAQIVYDNHDDTDKVEACALR